MVTVTFYSDQFWNYDRVEEESVDCRISLHASHAFHHFLKLSVPPRMTLVLTFRVLIYMPPTGNGYPRACKFFAATRKEYRTLMRLECETHEKLIDDNLYV